MARGFTLVELVMVLTLVGAVALFAAPKLLDLGSWRLQATSDQLRAQMQAMQRLALLQRRAVTVTITSGGAVFAYDGGGATLASVACPAALPQCIAEGGSRSATFNAQNSGITTTSTGSALPITLSDGGNAIAWVLEPDTGLLRTAP